MSYVKERISYDVKGMSYVRERISYDVKGISYDVTDTFYDGNVLFFRLKLKKSILLHIK